MYVVPVDTLFKALLLKQPSFKRLINWNALLWRKKPSILQSLFKENFTQQTSIVFISSVAIFVNYLYPLSLKFI